jgi:hypothetical protein
VTTPSQAPPDGRRKPRRAPLPQFSPPPVRPLDLLPPGYTTNPLPPMPLPPESGQETPPEDPQSDEPTSGPPSEPGWLSGARDAVKGLRDGLRTREPSDPTGTFSREPDLDESTVAKMFIGVTAVLVSLGAWLVSRRNQTLTIRRPDEIQEDRIAQPLSRIVMRHFPIEAFPDLVDGCRLIGAVSEYVTDGPLIISALNQPEE